MATNITTFFDSYYLTSHLPETVDIGTSAEKVTVKVSIGGNVIFSSVFYPYNQVVAFRDLRSIVEAEMIEQEYDMAPLVIEAMEPGITSSVVNNVQVVYCDFKNADGSEVFLNNHFRVRSDIFLSEGVVFQKFVNLYIFSCPLGGHLSF